MNAIPPRDRETRVLRVAGLQLAARPGAIEANLEHATPWLEEAVRRGARLVVLPELYSSGYFLTRDIWDAAEPPAGPTLRWLKHNARRLGIHLGCGFLQAEGDDFFNTFVLCGPEGEIAGRVGKRNAETYFFQGIRGGTHVIETPFGRVGVGICADNHFVFLPLLMQAAAVDLMLMPHASPAPTRPGGLVNEHDITGARAKARGMAPLYARLLGVPAVFVNQVGPMGGCRGRRPGILFKLLDPDNFRLTGLSTIADTGGQVKAELGWNEEGIVIADVTLDPARKARIRPESHGGWLHPGSAVLRRLILPLDGALGRLSYALSPSRKRRARRVSSAAGSRDG